MFEMIEVVLPRTTREDAEQDLAMATRFLNTLSLISAPLFTRMLFGKPQFVLEIAAHGGAVRFLLGTQGRYRSFLEKQIYAHYPDARVQRVSKSASAFPHGIVRTGFLRSAQGHDSLEALVRSFRRMRKADSVSVRYTVHSAEKANFAVTALITVSARTGEGADRLFQDIAASFGQYEAVQGSSQMPHVFSAHVDHLARLYRILRMHHAPSARMIPKGIPSSGTLLGHATYGGISVPLYVSDTDRKRHVYCVGHAGTGRRVLLLNMIMQDILAGKRVGIIDVEGELADEVRHRISRDDRFDARNVILCSSLDEATSILSHMDVLKNGSLYIDEFQALVPNAGEKLLAEASGLGVCLVLTHSSAAAAGDRMRAELLDSIGTLISYGVHAEDAALLREHRAPAFTDADLKYLPKFSAAIRLSVGGSLQYACTMATDKTAVL